MDQDQKHMPTPEHEGAVRLSLDVLGEALERSTPLPLNTFGGALVEAKKPVEKPVQDYYLRSIGRIVSITVALCIGAFLISIDRTIITVAVPAITARFHSSADTGWYASAYLITSCAFIPLFGRLYTTLDAKWTYLTCLVVFGAGSALCGFAPSSTTLICGRAIAGLGSAGLFPGTLVIVARCVKPELRVLLMALGGLAMTAAGIAGPLLGGVLVTHLNWRWCFIINLPAVGLLSIFIIFGMKLPKQESGQAQQVPASLRSFDIIGAVLVLGTAVSLCMALHEASATRQSWKSLEVIGLLATCVALAGLLAMWLRRTKETAILPLRLLTNRTVAAAATTSFGLYGGFTVLIFYLPTYYQAVYGSSALRSAVNTLPYMVTAAVASLLSAVLVMKTALPHQTAIVACAVFGCTLAVLGALLMSAIRAYSALCLVVCQVLLGIGIGLAMQQGQNSLQFALQKHDLSIAMAIIQFGQNLGGAIAAAAGEAVFLEVLVKSKPETPGSSTAADWAGKGTTAFGELPERYLTSWLAAYGSAFRATQALALGFLVVALAAALCMKSDGLRKRKAMAKDQVHESASSSGALSVKGDAESKQSEV